MEAHTGADRVAVGVLLLIRMCVQQADSSVCLQAAFLAEDQEGASSTDLQVMWQQEGDGLADQGLGYAVSLFVTQLQGSGTKLHGDLDTFTPQLSEI